MITKMDKYSFIFLSGESEPILKQIQDLGLIDITRGSRPCDKRTRELLEEAETLNARIKVLESGKPGADSLYSTIAGELSSLKKTLADIAAWGQFDNASIDCLKENGIDIAFYSCPAKKFDAKWADEYPLEEISESDSRKWFVIAWEGMEDASFPVKRLERPAADFSAIKSAIALKEAELKQREDEISKECATLPELKSEYAQLLSELDLALAQASGEKASEGELSVMTGFAPCENVTDICNTLDTLPLYYTREAAEEGDNPPIKLHNGKFASMFEVFTGMYGMPVYGEFDPTPILAPFFLLFFALCMGDAGYGIILAVIGLMLKGKSGGLAKSWKLIITLGIGTFVVGIFLGTFFGVDLTGASWVPEWLRNCMITGEVSGLSVQMLMAIGIGVFHICLAMVVKTICYTKRFGFRESVSSWGWTVLIIGGILVAILSMVGFLGENATKAIIITIAVISSLGIFIFNKPGRNPALNIGAGLWDTYNMATGLLGDVLSYIRLYALGLAGGMLGAAFNNLAVMIKGCGVPGVDLFGFIIILVIGHALNIAMSCLGAFVHPLRLTFVEYFKNSGYEGKGVKYKPLEKSNN